MMCDLQGGEAWWERVVALNTAAQRPPVLLLLGMWGEQDRLRLLL